MTPAIKAMMSVSLVILECIPSDPLGTPSGPIYAALMGHGVRLDQYQAMLRALQGVNAITEADHCLHRGEAYQLIVDRFTKALGKVRS